LALSTENLEGQGIRITGFTLPKEQIITWEEELGTIDAIQKATDYFTDRMNGRVTVQFRPFTTPAAEAQIL
jgi:hypothetical protein